MGHVTASCDQFTKAAPVLVATSLHGVGNRHASGALAPVIVLLSHRTGARASLQVVLLLLACHTRRALKLVKHPEACVKHRTKM